MPPILSEGLFCEMPADFYNFDRLDQDNKTMLYLHGGGFVLLSRKTHRNLLFNIAQVGKIKIIAVDYPLAPEFPFPHALNSALRAYQELLKQVPAKRILIAGDSAGGGLALSLQLRIKELGLPKPAGLILLSPWLDLTCTGKSISRNASRDLMLTPQQLRRYRRQYCPTELYREPLVSPLWGQFQGTPPTFIQVGDSELLLDDARRLEEFMNQQSLDVELQIWPKVFHVWQAMGEKLPAAIKAIREICRFIGRL